MPPPTRTPVGLELAKSARTVSRAFDAALTRVGGSPAVWTILVSLLAESHGTQRDIARAVGIEGPTLTHHLNRMETEGLVSRRRDPGDRRAQVVALTDAGLAEFRRLRDVVAEFDQRLRTGLGDDEVDTFRRLLVRVRANVDDDRTPS